MVKSDKVRPVGQNPSALGEARLIGVGLAGTLVRIKSKFLRFILVCSRTKPDIDDVKGAFPRCDGGALPLSSSPSDAATAEPRPHRRPPWNGVGSAEAGFADPPATTKGPQKSFRVGVI